MCAASNAALARPSAVAAASPSWRCCGTCVDAIRLQESHNRLWVLLLQGYSTGTPAKRNRGSFAYLGLLTLYALVSVTCFLITKHVITSFLAVSTFLCCGSCACIAMVTLYALVSSRGCALAPWSCIPNSVLCPELSERLTRGPHVP